MMTREKLDYVGKDILKRLGESVLPFMLSTDGRENLRQVSVDLQLLLIAYDRALEELEPPKLQPIPENKEPDWSN